MSSKAANKSQEIWAQPNLSLETTRLRRDEAARGWVTTLITTQGRQAWAAALCSVLHQAEGVDQ